MSVFRLQKPVHFTMQPHTMEAWTAEGKGVQPCSLSTHPLRNGFLFYMVHGDQRQTHS